MTTEVAVQKAKQLTQISFDDVVVTRDDVRAYLCQEATDKEIFMAMGIMASYKLNPFKREIHLIKYKGAPAEVIVGYETYLKRAERSGKLNGWKAYIEDGKAFCVIHRKDWAKPFEWYVDLKEFDKKRATWTQIPDFMGKKVVIAQAFRLAFPDELGGMPYTKEEHEIYDIVEEPVKTKPVTAEPVSKKQEPPAVVEPDLPNRPAVPAAATEPVMTREPVKEEQFTAITVTDLLDCEAGTAVEKMVATVEWVKTKQVGAKNTKITDYGVTDGASKAMISVFGDAAEGVEKGTPTAFHKIIVSVYKNNLQYVAKTAEAI